MRWVFDIGDKFLFDSKRYKVMEDDNLNCNQCVFWDTTKCGTDPDTKQQYGYIFSCIPEDRYDNKYVYYQEVSDDEHFETEGFNFIDDPYKTLKDVLNDAEYQASGGKGKERHAANNNFEEQVICSVQRLLYRHPFGGDAYQVIKKIIEAGRLYDTHGWETAYKETLGAINYAGAMGHLIKEYGQKEQSENLNNLEE